MSKGKRYHSEAKMHVDPRTGARVRQVTGHRSIHHHPFFFVQAYDERMRWLFFVSHRTGTPQVFAEDCHTNELVQLTDRPDIAEWSVHPAHDGSALFFTAGTSGWRLDMDSLEESKLVGFASDRMQEDGMVAAAMGTTGLSHDDRWWAVAYKLGSDSELAIVDTTTGESDVILRRDSISHIQFCPDDSELLFYAGPLTDRVWIINRDGSGNRRLYRRQSDEWITHESWIPGKRELAFVDWPNGMRSIHVDTGVERHLTSFNAWHAISNRDGTCMVADTNFPDIGLQLFDPLDGTGDPSPLCHPAASSIGAHWNGPFPYGHGPVSVYAPQHTHPHPSFSPDGKRVVFTSDQTGCSQVYEVEILAGLD
jgi:oligogalacturonide lyase